MASQMEFAFSTSSEDEGCFRLLLPSELYHENSKITCTDWALRQRAQQDPVQRLLMRSAARQLDEAYDRIQWGAKQYLRAPRIALPAARHLLPGSLAEAFWQRRSVRSFSGQAIPLSHLAALLHACYGVTGYRDPQTQSYPRRTVPSGGGLYPLEVYALVLNIAGLAPGAYHYEAYNHSLEQLIPGDLHQALWYALLYEELTVGPAAVLVLSGLFGRSRYKYGERSYRLVLKELGHAGQNVCLAATALGLGACPVDGFVEDRINDLLSFNGVDETALYLIVLGKERA